MKPPMKRSASARKVVDESAEVRCVAGRAPIREEVWQKERGEVFRYNLAFICHELCTKDHGRALGYDNQHGHHHRHYMGHVEPFWYVGYDVLLTRFLTEVE